MAHHTRPAPMAQVLIPSDPDVGRLATVRPQAVDRVRRQMIGDKLHPTTIDRLLNDVGTEPPALRVMQFLIDGEVVQVCITDQQLFDGNGVDAAALYCFPELRIYLTTHYPRPRWPRLIRHELGHAWFHLKHRPIGEEQRCHFITSFWFEIIPQYEAQGGDAALMRLPVTDPDDLIEHGERWDTSAC